MQIAQSTPNRVVRLAGAGAFFTLDQKTIVCTEGAKPTCLDLGGGSTLGAAALAMGPIGGVAPLLTAKDFPGALAKGQVTVAGRTGQCFEIDGSKIAGAASSMTTGTVCVDTKTGVALRVDGFAPGFKMEATEVGEPTAADFVLPAPVTVVPTTPTVPAR